MRRNVEYNAMGAEDTAPTDNVHATKKEEWKGKVRVNEGDALSVPPQQLPPRRGHRILR